MSLISDVSPPHRRHHQHHEHHHHEREQGLMLVIYRNHLMRLTSPDDSVSSSQFSELIATNYNHLHCSADHHHIVSKDCCLWTCQLIRFKSANFHFATFPPNPGYFSAHDRSIPKAVASADRPTADWFNPLIKPPIRDSMPHMKSAKHRHTIDKHVKICKVKSPNCIIFQTEILSTINLTREEMSD